MPEEYQIIKGSALSLLNLNNAKGKTIIENED